MSKHIRSVLKFSEVIDDNFSESTLYLFDTGYDELFPDFLNKENPSKINQIIKSYAHTVAELIISLKDGVNIVFELLAPYLNLVFIKNRPFYEDYLDNFTEDISHEMIRAYMKSLPYIYKEFEKIISDNGDELLSGSSVIKYSKQFREQANYFTGMLINILKNMQDVFMLNIAWITLLPIVKNRPHEFNDLLRYFSLGDEIDTFIKRNKIINLVNDIVNNEEIINYSPDSMEEWHNLYPEN